MTVNNRYLDGSYADSNPEFGDDSSTWKVENALKALEDWNIPHRKIAEVGCGGGAIIADLCERLKPESGVGYEPMPEAFAVAKKRSTDVLTFRHEAVTADVKDDFDVVLCFDVFEHVENPYEFIRALKGISKRFLFHIPLDMNAQMVFRKNPILKTRKQVGHLHYFSKDTALATLKDCGLKVEGHFYTCGADAGSHNSLGYRLAKLPRKVAFALQEDFAVRALGGYSLMVFATH